MNNLEQSGSIEKKYTTPIKNTVSHFWLYHAKENYIVNVKYRGGFRGGGTDAPFLLRDSTPADPNGPILRYPFLVTESNKVPSAPIYNKFERGALAKKRLFRPNSSKLGTEN